MATDRKDPKDAQISRLKVILAMLVLGALGAIYVFGRLQGTTQSVLGCLAEDFISAAITALFVYIAVRLGALGLAGLEPIKTGSEQIDHQPASSPDSSSDDRASVPRGSQRNEELFSKDIQDIPRNKVQPETAHSSKITVEYDVAMLIKEQESRWQQRLRQNIGIQWIKHEEVQRRLRRAPGPFSRNTIPTNVEIDELVDWLVRTGFLESRGQPPLPIEYRISDLSHR